MRPGSISVTLAAAGEAHHDYPDEWRLAFLSLGIGGVLTLTIACFTFRASTQLLRFMGKSGVDAMTRIFGFLPVCIGMKFILDVIADLYHALTVA